MPDVDNYVEGSGRLQLRRGPERGAPGAVERGGGLPMTAAPGPVLGTVQGWEHVDQAQRRGTG
ncbi:hypothetical protein, partial [Nocardia sp. CC201C]|uniref:hypothetical protein n=1 Tax=Nocardia sp. CC201C TaxID=3044575 RepID=UPI0024A9788C